MLVMCVIPTAVVQLNRRMKNRKYANAAVWLISVFTVFMVLGRLLSGVHWATDIIGGAILSVGLVWVYYGSVGILSKEKLVCDKEII